MQKQPYCNAKAALLQQTMKMAWKIYGYHELSLHLFHNDSSILQFHRCPLERINKCESIFYG